jgi:hypothetical protein
MKRWNTDTQESEEHPEIDTFIEEILSVCKRHGLSIGHEDGHGAFEIHPYSPECFEGWLRDAHWRPK